MRSYREASATVVGHYRYTLKRVWGDGDLMLWLMLNPSKADGRQDDPTIVRCVNYAESWGFGGMFVGNMFAWRATQPNHVKAHSLRGENIIGPGNDDAIQMMLGETTRTVAGWGATGVNWVRGRPDEVIKVATDHRDLKILGLTSRSQPRHPLYAPIYADRAKTKILRPTIWHRSTKHTSDGARNRTGLNGHTLGPQLTCKFCGCPADKVQDRVCSGSEADVQSDTTADLF